MRRIFLTIAFSLVALTVHAQTASFRHTVDVALGTGIHTLFLSPVDGDGSLGMGVLLDAKYAYQINDCFAVGVGLGFGSMHSAATFSYTDVQHDVLMPGAFFAGDLSTSFNGWKEKQNLIYLGIPLEAFYFVRSADDLLFRFGAGVQLTVPLWGGYKSSEGSYSRTLYLPNTGVVYDDLPSHGLGTYSDRVSGSFDTKVGLAAIVDAGAFVYQEEPFGLYVGLYGMLGFNSIANVDGRDVFDGDYSYQGMVASRQVTRALPFQVGIKVSMRFGLSKSSAE